MKPRSKVDLLYRSQGIYLGIESINTFNNINERTLLGTAKEALLVKKNNERFNHAFNVKGVFKF